MKSWIFVLGLSSAIVAALAWALFFYDLHRSRRRRELERTYSPDEQRVCDYLQALTNGSVGCGDDPIGFLIASHGAVRAQRDEARMAERNELAARARRLLSERELIALAGLAVNVHRKRWEDLGVFYDEDARNEVYHALTALLTLAEQVRELDNK